MRASELSVVHGSRPEVPKGVALENIVRGEKVDKLLRGEMVMLVWLYRWSRSTSMSCICKV